MPEQQPLKSSISSTNLVKRDEQGRILPGQQSLNPSGKPIGVESFKTKWLRFIDKVAKQNNISSDEVDEQLLAVAFKQAKDANYPFYKDIQDRIYGTALQKFGGDKDHPIPIMSVPYVQPDNSDKKDNEDESPDTGGTGGKLGLQDGVSSNLLDSIGAERQNKDADLGGERVDTAPKEGSDTGLQEHPANT
jgi:hypothetical protein